MKKERRTKVFYFDCAGANRHGRGSGFAWIRTDKEAQQVIWVDRRTKNKAGYGALLDILRYLAPGSRAVIFTDYELLLRQFSWRSRVDEDTLHIYLMRARAIMEAKALDIELRSIPRKENLARKLLKRREDCSWNDVA